MVDSATADVLMNAAFDCDEAHHVTEELSNTSFCTIDDGQTGKKRRRAGVQQASVYPKKIMAKVSQIYDVRTHARGMLFAEESNALLVYAAECEKLVGNV